MSSAVPEGWSIRSLEGKVDILSGFPFKSAQFTDDKSKIGLIRIRDLVKQRLETFYKGDFDDLYVVTKDDILIGMDGDFNIVKWKSKEALLNQRICKVKAVDGKGFDTDFLFHSLEPELQDIHATTGATTVKHLSVKDIRGIQKAYPPLPEQQKIATILSSVDDVITKTTAQIDKLKDLKTGMMQELLTKGIGHTEFRDSPVGRIPVGWDVKGMYDACDEIFLGLTAKVDYTDSNGVYLVRATDISGGALSFDKARQITHKQHQSLTKYRKAKRGDVLISKSGSLGVCAFVETDTEFSIYESIIVLQPKKGICDSKYLLWLMRSCETQTRLLGGTVGSTVGHLNLGDFRKLKIPIPPLNEQIKCGHVLDALDNKHLSAQTKLDSVTSLKKALMQDLLTGKVRVSVN